MNNHNPSGQTGWSAEGSPQGRPQGVGGQTTLIGGGKVNITADKTTVTGGMIANATRNNDGSLTDKGQGCPNAASAGCTGVAHGFNLVTDELIINDLQDHNKSSSKGFNVNVSAGWAKGNGSQVQVKLEEDFDKDMA